jgi:hypothetical protein
METEFTAKGTGEPVGTVIFEDGQLIYDIADEQVADDILMALEESGAVVVMQTTEGTWTGPRMTPEWFAGVIVMKLGLRYRPRSSTGTGFKETDDR